tara:strand:- start:62683 stop:63159 length:477 start_codon:yes stop_codon:yes gene_type:complete
MNQQTPPPALPAPSGTSPAAINGIISSAENLTEIIQQETACLRAADSNGFKDLHAQKEDFAHRYEAQFQKLIANKEELKALAPEDLARLTQARKKMTDASIENFAAMERTKKSLNRLSERIMKLVRNQSQHNTNLYSASGALYSSQGSAQSIGIGEDA